MSSMKKNTLAVALVAGMGLAGNALAYDYGTTPNLATPENVPYEMLVNVPGNYYKYTMHEGIVFDIQVQDNAVNFTQGFTVRVALNQRCNPHNVNTNPASPPMNVGVCAATGDGAQFDTTWTPTAQGYDTSGNPVGPAGNGLALDPSLNSTWDVAFDGYDPTGTIASFRITPKQGITNPQNPSTGTLLTWNNAHLISLNEFAEGQTNKVDAEFWMVNTTNDARFVNSTMSRTILNRVSATAACTNIDGADVDKYIDVADSWLSDLMPKSRFSFDGRLGSATDANGAYPGGAPASQTIDLGDITINANDSTGYFDFWTTDSFTTVLSGDGGGWLAFDNDSPADEDSNSSFDDYLDDVYLYSGSCTSGELVARGEVDGNTVTFQYDPVEAGLISAGGAVVSDSVRLTVCAFADSDTVINDQPITAVTTFHRNGMFQNGSKDYAGCPLLPLRYNGSTMEVFTLNRAANATQRTFLRLTNRSATDGYVRLQGITDYGHEAEQQVSIYLKAGESVQVTSQQLEGTNPVPTQTGAWAVPAGDEDVVGGAKGKWRAVVTAEFPGLVASSYVRSISGDILANITDSDTRGEQYMRDGIEGTLASLPGTRPSDVAQEFTPDFRGNGQANGNPAGPNGTNGTGTGGTTDPCGNPGYGTGEDHTGDDLDDTRDESNEAPWCTQNPGGFQNNP